MFTIGLFLISPIILFIASLMITVFEKH